MTKRDEGLTSCPLCGHWMDVSTLPPFSKVACPACQGEIRVKCEFGPYTLTRRHAIGGMSLVFIAHDVSLDREVALKILNEDYTADKVRMRAFEEEARLTASLSHPNIVRVFTTGWAFGRLYIAMELVPGGHLEQQIKEKGKIPERELLPLAVQIAQGLKAAHAAGLIHRDIKPGNILFDAHNNAKIVDFGLALVTHGGKALATELWATPYYVPPETIEGQSEDFRSDIYAFGATLYHALAGFPPCDEETMSTDRLRAAKKNVIPLATADPLVSEEVSDIVDRAMAYRPEDRYSSYDELIEALQRAAKFADHALRPDRASRLAMLRKRKRQRTQLMIGGGAVLVFLGIGLTTWLLREPPPAPVAAETPPVSLEIESPADPLAAPLDAARRYRDARESMAAGRYDEARKIFLRVHEHEEVQEPTRTWAGIEAIMNAYFEGDPELAQSLASQVLAHLEKAGDEVSAIRETLQPVLQELSALESTPGDLADQPDAENTPQIFGWMVGGLKLWEQGRLEAATLRFQKVLAAQTDENPASIAAYQARARDYLDDFATLEPLTAGGFPASPEACDALAKSLEEKLPALRTAGRAKFNLRAWQLDLKRHAHVLRRRATLAAAALAAEKAEAQEAQRSPEVLQQEAQKSIESWDFARAAELLRELPAEAQTAAIEAKLQLLDAASRLIKQLTSDVQTTQGPVPVTLKLQANGKSAQLASNEQGQLQLTEADAVTPFSWRQLDPNSVIGLYRFFVNRIDDETERAQRHEGAVAFSWLVGDRTQAAVAASRLAEDDPLFKLRWQKITRDLEQP